MSKETAKKLRELEDEMALKSRITDLQRSRSITVGTAFGGTTEISMRGDGGNYLWCVMQPVEVTELIHQLAANIGCHVALKPRDDFGSWREWRISEAEKNHLNGFPPFVNDMAVFQRLGMSNFNQNEAESLMDNWLKLKKYETIPEENNATKNTKSSFKQNKTKMLKAKNNNEALATKKNINSRESH
jgi:hypothetical protein